MNKKFYNIATVLLVVVPICCGLLAVGAAIAYSTRPITSAPSYSAPTRLPDATRIVPVKTSTPMPIRTQTPKPAQAPSQTAMIVSRTVTPSPVPVFPSPTSAATLATATFASISVQTPIATTAQIPTVTSWPTLDFATATLPPAPAFCICNEGDTLNCDDFSTWTEAQACFLKCGGVTNDVHQLDRNSDGTACEELR
jgi:hypothetical protein